MLAIVAVLVAWFFIVIGALRAALTFPLAWFMDETTYAKNQLRALDKAAAAYLDLPGGGRYTVSAECGAATHGWLIYLRRVIDWLLKDGHCVGAAKSEGLQ